MNHQSYNQIRAMFAIAKASFRSIIRSPSAIIFSIAFPLTFIFVFGFIGGNGVSVEVAPAKHCDTINPVYYALKNVKVIRLMEDMTEEEMKSDLEKGRIDAIMDIEKNPNGNIPAYIVNIKTTKASQEKGNIFKSVLNNIFYTLNMQATHTTPAIAELKESFVEGREYKMIDFILPGQLGFSLLSSGVFGTAFVFLSLRITLVIKRFFATPIKRGYIVLGEAMSRLVFALLGALFIILIGHFFLDFTLVHGFATLVNMLLLCTIGLIIFMGFGFTVSGIAKTESTIPPFANMITLPQFLLSGTFFSITLFPAWLQPLCKALPLTYLNNAMRKVAFEGASLWDVNHEIAILLIWGVLIYALAIKVFKWE